MKELNYSTIKNSDNSETDKKINETEDFADEKGKNKLVLENL